MLRIFQMPPQKFKVVYQLSFLLTFSVVRCPFINPPENGNRTVYGYSNGSIAMFTCDIGYQIIGGNIRRVCQEDSTWSGTDLVCALKSKSTYSKGFTKLQYNRIVHGVVLTLSVLLKVSLLTGNALQI